MKQIKLLKEVKFDSIDFSKRFFKALKEERNVSREVQNEANEFFELIVELLNNINIDYNQNPFQKAKYEFQTELFNHPINVYLETYFFEDVEIYNQYKNLIRYFYQYNKHTNTIYLTSVVVGRDVVPNTLPTKLAHEIMHTFQYEKTGKDLLHPMKYYDNIKGLSTEQNDIIKSIKSIIYLSSHYEQEAYANELYHELQFIHPSNYLDILNSCNSYLAYKQLEKDVIKLSELKNNEFVISILKDYGFSYDYFIKQANIAVNNFAKKIGKVISLYIDETNDEFGRNGWVTDYFKR